MRASALGSPAMTRAKAPRPAVFWWLVAFNVVMYGLVIPCRLIG